MPKVKAPNCPNCHAPLAIRPGLAMVQCEYCGRQVMLKHTQHGMTAHPQQPPHPQHPQQPHPYASQQSWGVGAAHQSAQSFVNHASFDYRKHYTKYLIGSIAITLFAVAVPVYMSQRAQSQAMRAAQRAGAAVPSAAADTGNWEPIGSGVAVGRIDGDQVEDLLVLRQSDDANGPMYITAISGVGFARLWTAGPFGAGSDARIHTEVGVTAGHVVLVDEAGIAHVLDKQSGAPRHAITLTDRADRVCGSPDGERAWIAVTDKQHVALDLAAGTAKPQAEAPPWCPDAVSLRDNSNCWSADYHRNRRARAPCSDLPRKWRVDGFGNAYRLPTPSGFVAVGTKHPGTAFPMLVGLGPKGGVTWQRRVSESKIRESTPQFVDIAGDTIVVAYEVETWSWSAMGVDVATGATRWDLSIPGERISTLRFTVSPIRVYVVTSDHLWIYDATTGARLADLAP